MKVEFKEMATLVITPENGTENYALKKWFEGYTNETPSEEILSVNLISDESQTISNTAYTQCLCEDCKNKECDGWEGKVIPEDFIVKKCKGHFR